MLWQGLLVLKVGFWVSPFSFGLQVRVNAVLRVSVCYFILRMMTSMEKSPGPVKNMSTNMVR